MSAVEALLAAPTITVAEDERDSVTVTLTLPAGADSYSVYRVGPSGTRAYVRGAVSAAAPEPTVNVRDFEAPLGVPLTYTATVWAASAPTVTSSASATITVASSALDDPWLTDLARPLNSQQIVVEALNELQYQEPVGVHYVLGRRTPIVSSDVANAPSFELDFWTLDEDARDRARATLGSGFPMLLRTPPEQGVGNLYFAATDFREQRVRLAQYAERRWVVQCVQVERPDPSLYVSEALMTYEQVADEFATYAALKADRATYDDLAYDFAAEGASDVVPWPPVDV